MAALSPDERRAALIAATIPLLREHGAQVSTRQIAQAAGVAEGTIFGVFKDKPSLLRAAVLRALDPGSVLAGLRAIDLALPLRDRLVRAVRLVREHVADHGAILHLVRSGLFVDDSHGFVDIMAIRRMIVEAVNSIIEPDAPLLRRSPMTATRLLMSLVAGPPAIHLGVLDEPLADDEIVSIVLDGLLIRPQQTQPRES